MKNTKPQIGKALQQRSVALLACSSYSRPFVKEIIDTLFGGVSFSVQNGEKIFLKPNLVAATSKDGLACTNPEFVAAAAEWFLDHGAKVAVGDSPAFGSSSQVMRSCGMMDALKGLPVEILNLKRKQKVMLDCGISVSLSKDLLECDKLVNLPKVKSHIQMRVSLAVKNFFGAVVGCRKAYAHMRYGEQGNTFEALLVDLVSALPPGISLVDGIVAMHNGGPVKGEAFDLKIAAASRNPVALDTALLKILGVEERLSPLWLECKRRKMVGAEIGGLSFPLMQPESIMASGFVVPEILDPVRFRLGRFIKNGLKKIF